MSSALCPVVVHPDCVRHDPGAEVWVGLRTPGTEVAERVTRIEERLRAAGHPVVAAESHDDRVLRAVHDRALLEFLATIWPRWVEHGYPAMGPDRVLPYLWPAAVTGELADRVAVSPHAEVGRYAYDTMSLVGPGSWEAIRGAVDAALTASALVASGAPVAYALTRPPGHHATRGTYGGSCYLNNAAVAAQALRDAGYGRVAVVDVDAHHGNGTQEIFYRRPDVLYASAHVDPGAGWFPHVVGFADETGIGAGAGTTLNVPVAPGGGDDAWLDAVTRCAGAAETFGADALVVSLGVDAAADDPESPLQVTRDGYRRTGAALGALGLPTVAVQEGGYHLPTLGELVGATLEGLAAGR